MKYPKMRFGRCSKENPSSDMRVTGLLALAVLFPAIAYAALININTADATLLDTLPGIGPTYAARIVDYRTAHGPFARIEDIQNVSGIGPSTYANIAALITVGDTSGTSAASASTASTTNTSTFSGGAATYVPPPPAITLVINASQTATAEVPLRLTAHAMTKGNTVDLNARILWGFGDGSSNEGMVVEKVYRYPGTYLVTITATDGDSASAHEELAVTVLPARVQVLAVSSEGITIGNDAHERLDLSGWRFLSDGGSFRVPEGTMLLPGARVFFPSSITNLAGASNAALAYPSGIVAARYTPPASVIATAATVAQLSPVVPSYKKVQKVEKIISTKAPLRVHENAVVAPTALANSAAVGAAVLPASSVGTSTEPKPPLFRSPWTAGLLGIMTLAGGAFIFL